ncbi:MAG: homocysteine S-methyltransferase family protein [Polyangiaceae bacterium]
MFYPGRTAGYLRGMEVTVLDGPMGTELLRRGVATPVPVWSAAALESDPNVVANVHRDYAAAGAVVHTTNTFRTQPRVFGDRWEDLARTAVRLARESVPGGHRVAGAVAPIEECYRPDLSPGLRGREDHRRVARLLAAEGVDLLLCETFAHPAETCVAVEECVATGLPTWVALTAGPDSSLLSPEAMRRIARDCVHGGASAVLVNCTPATQTLPFVEALASIGVAFGAYANAGAAREGLGWSADPAEASRAYARLARTWLDAGATIVGGCCGTGPAHIEALRAVLD